jgi:hypothetical protein
MPRVPDNSTSAEIHDQVSKQLRVLNSPSMNRQARSDDYPAYHCRILSLARNGLGGNHLLISSKPTSGPFRVPGNQAVFMRAGSCGRLAPPTVNGT